MSIKTLAIEVKLDKSQADKDLRSLESQLRKLENQKAKLGVSTEAIEQAKKRVSEIDSELKRLSQRKAEIPIDMRWYRDLESRIQHIKQELLDFRDEKIIIKGKLDIERGELEQAENALNNLYDIRSQLEAKNKPISDDLKREIEAAEGSFKDVLQSVKQLESELKDCNKSIESLTAYSNNLKFEKEKAKPFADEVKKIEQSVDKLNKEKIKLQAKIDGEEVVKKELETVNKAIDKVNGKKAEAEVQVKDAKQAEEAVWSISRAIDQLNAKAVTMKTFSNITGKIGDAMLHPVKTLGNNGNNWFGKLAYTATKGVAYSALYRGTSGVMNVIDEGMSRGVTRYDTNIAGRRTLANMGVEAQAVDKAVTQLGEDLKGLPTSLNEGMEGMVNLTSVLDNNVDKARQMYNAVNDGILAGGGSAENTSRAIRQLSQSMGKGVIDAEAFNSLLDNNMAPALVQVAKMFNMNSAELKSAVSDGTISVDQFIDKLIELDQKGNGAFKDLHTMALEANEGIATNITNAKNSVARGIESILTETNAVLSDSEYKSVGHIISMMGDSFQQGLQGVAGFIKDHKTEIISFVDTVADKAGKLWDKLKQFDVQAFFEGFWSRSENFRKIFGGMFTGGKGMLGGLADMMFGDSQESKKLGQFAGWWVETGAMFKAASRGAKWIGNFYDMKRRYIDSHSREIAAGSGLLGSLNPTKFLKTGVWKIKGMLNIGSGMSKVASQTEELSKVSEKVSTPFKFNPEKFKSNIANLAVIAGGAVEIMLYAEAIKQAYDKVPTDYNGLAEKMAALGSVATMMTGLNKLNGAAIGSITSLKDLGNCKAAIGAVANLVSSVEIMALSEAIKQFDEKVPPIKEGDIVDKLSSMVLLTESMTLMNLTNGFIFGVDPFATILGAIGAAANFLAAGEIAAMSEAIKQFNEKVPANADELLKKIDSLKQIVSAVGDENFAQGLDKLKGTSGNINLSSVKTLFYDLKEIGNYAGQLTGVEFPVDFGATMTRMKTAISYLGEEELAESLANFAVDPTTTDRATKALTCVQNIAKLIDPIKQLSASMTGEINLENIQANIPAMATALSTIASRHFPEFGDSFDEGGAVKAQSAITALLQVLPKMKELDSAITEQKLDAESYINSFEAMARMLNGVNDSGLATALGDFVPDAVVEDVNKAVATMSGIVDGFKTLNGKDFDADQLTGLFGKIRKVIHATNDFTQTDDKGNTKSVMNSDLNHQAQGFAKYAEDFKKTAAVFADISASIDSLVAVQGKVEQFDPGVITPVIKGLAGIFGEKGGEIDFGDLKSQSEAYNEAKQEFRPAVESMNKLTDVLIVLGGKKLDTTSLENLVTDTQTFLNNLSSLNSEGARTQVEQIEQLVTDFQTFITELQGMNPQFNETGAAWANELIAGFESKKIEDSLKKMASAAQKILADMGGWDAVGQNWAGKILNGFKTKMNDKATGIGTIVNSLKLTIRGDAGWTDVGTAIGTKIAAGIKQKIQEAVSSSNYSGSTPNLPSNLTPTSGRGTATAGDYSTTGRNPLRRASGGAVGTDTVPAMLTPGEFIVSRGAAQRAGSRLLNAINNRDLVGAYRQLQYKYSGFQNAQTISHVTTNVTNHNEQTKTINIKGDLNDRGLELKAGRFMRAL